MLSNLMSADTASIPSLDCTMRLLEDLHSRFLPFFGNGLGHRPDVLIDLFWVAVILRHEDIFHVLLDYGLDIDGQDNLGDAPILVAARSGHEGIMCVLMDAHAKIEIRGKSGNSPLLLLLPLAAEEGYVGTLKKLLERGLKVYKTNRDGNTALQLAPAFEITHALIAAYADINVLNKEEIDAALLPCGE
jgi:ankyrin repeat protein